MWRYKTASELYPSSSKCDKRQRRPRHSCRKFNGNRTGTWCSRSYQIQSQQNQQVLLPQHKRKYIKYILWKRHKKNIVFIEVENEKKKKNVCSANKLCNIIQRLHGTLYYCVPRNAWGVFLWWSAGSQNVYLTHEKPCYNFIITFHNAWSTLNVGHTDITQVSRMCWWFRECVCLYVSTMWAAQCTRAPQYTSSHLCRQNKCSPYVPALFFL